MCVQGRCMVEVPMNVGQDGNSVCAAQGLTCASVPTLSPAPDACLAFNPGASSSMDLNGWAQAVHCNDNTGLACTGRVNDCHYCPLCNASLDCTTGATALFDDLYAECVE